MTVVRSGEAVPVGCDFYVVGGGEDLPQALAATQLGAGSDSSPLRRAVEGGAVVLAVCAGLQILGRTFGGPRGISLPGVGLLDCTTRPGRRRCVGELAVEPSGDLGIAGLLSGYENHAGLTTVGSGAAPLGTVRTGVGNGAGGRVDGARSGKVIGTYMHGPVLARNPALADLLLSWVVGDLEPLDDRESDELRRQRLAGAGRGLRSRGWSSLGRRSGV